jgi:hypothetical protein
MIFPKNILNTKLSSTSQSVLYECPAGKTATFKSIFCVNKNAGIVFINLYKKTASTGNISELLTPNLPLDQNESAEEDRIVELEAGDQLLGDATVAAMVTVEGDGFEKDT